MARLVYVLYFTEIPHISHDARWDCGRNKCKYTNGRIYVHQAKCSRNETPFAIYTNPTHKTHHTDSKMRLVLPHISAQPPIYLYVLKSYDIALRLGGMKVQPPPGTQWCQHNTQIEGAAPNQIVLGRGSRVRFAFVRIYSYMCQYKYIYSHTIVVSLPGSRYRSSGSAADWPQTLLRFELGMKLYGWRDTEVCFCTCALAVFRAAMLCVCH